MDTETLAKLAYETAREHVVHPLPNQAWPDFAGLSEPVKEAYRDIAVAVRNASLVYLNKRDMCCVDCGNWRGYEGHHERGCVLYEAEEASVG